MALKNYSYMGKGPIYAGEPGKALLPVGNCSELNFSVETSRISQPDYTSPGGGEANAIERVTAVTFSMNLLDISPKNLSLAYRGTEREITGGVSVTGEEHLAFPGGLIEFNDIPDISDPESIVVEIPEVPGDGENPGTPAVVLELNTDYEITRSGIVILETSSKITNILGTTIEVEYDKADATIMEALVNSGKEYRLVFDGLNEAQSGKTVKIRAHRVKFSPTSGTSFIGDEFAELPLEGSVLSDNSIVGSNLSKFFQVVMEN